MSRSDRRSRRDCSADGAQSSGAIPALVAFIIVVAFCCLLAGATHYFFPFLVWDILHHFVDPNWRRPGESFKPLGSDPVVTSYEALLDATVWTGYKDGQCFLPFNSDVNSCFLSNQIKHQNAPYLAASTGNLDLFAFYYKRGMNRDFTEAKKGKGLLAAAVESYNEDLVRWMLGQGRFAFNVNAGDQDGFTPLAYLLGRLPGKAKKKMGKAAAENEPRERQRGKEKKDANEEKFWAFTERTAKLLLSHGADANVVSHEGYTPLVYAMTTERAPLVMALLENGADSAFIVPGHAKDGVPMDCFDLAIKQNHLDIVYAFLVNNIDPCRSHHPEHEHRIYFAIAMEADKAVQAFRPTLSPAELAEARQFAAGLAERENKPVLIQIARLLAYEQ